MTTAVKIRSLPLLILVILLSQGCTKKCQQPPTEKFKTFTGQQWRLVETTDQDPAFKSLSNTTFLIWEFGKDYTGKINKVLNNKLYDTPIVQFEYNVDPDNNMVAINFSATGSTQSSTQQSPDGIVYSYDLGRDFNLTNGKTGASYRFVPFQGIVDPDNQCEF
jgi:hypothetical protein